MENSKRILKVPEDSGLRDTLREQTRLLVASKNLRAPLSFKYMEQLAIELLKSFEISDLYIDFTIVLMGNESWRKTVEATPYNRRLLLLPQCLKENASCKGIFDQLGLVCAACKACPIDDILLEAEKLAYVTLVAEGTTVAIGLVEEGAIDAVIGVSCMPVLQRSFGSVSKAAVPVIGIPLMYDGCENTKIDLQWLYDEVSVYKPNELLRPISVSDLQIKIRSFFENGTLNRYFNSKDITENIAKESLQIGGQRMRPLVAALSFVAYSNSASTNILHPLLLIIECFHKASLIHDDIQDDANLRYSEPTVHEKYGTAQAINIGDYLIGKGYQVFSELPINEKLMAKGLRQISASHLKLTKGQGADLHFNQGPDKPNVDELLQIFKEKTGEAIKVALLLGAILGEADDSELQILSDFSDLFGISYQIRDDLNEFRAEEKDEVIANFPFLLALLVETNTHKNFNTIAEFRMKVLEQGVHIKADEILNNYVQRCYSKLDKLGNAKLRLSLYAVLGKIFKTGKVEF